jgi:hypothetical protein
MQETRARLLHVDDEVVLLVEMAPGRDVPEQRGIKSKPTNNSVKDALELGAIAWSD